MAKAIVEQEYTPRAWAPWVRVILIGAGLGLIFWVLTLLLTQYAIEPLTCNQVTNAKMCTNATGIAGNISTIVVALIAILVLVRFGVTRPVIVAIASAAVLWDLAALTQGLFWLEAAGWSILLYAIAYLLFTWIVRYAQMWAVITLSLLIILIVRIALIL